MERQVQKEREKEEGQFNDKEAFVTEAYPFILDVSYWLRLQKQCLFFCCFRLGVFASRVLVRLFTVLYFFVRSSRSSALRYGLPSCMSVKTT